MNEQWTLFRNGRFVDPAVGPEPIGEALLARGGRIVAVGSLAACRAAAPGDVPAVDLHGRTALPGLVDAHVHLRSLGESLRQCDLSAARSRRQAVAMVAAFARSHPDVEWVQARGFRLNAWDDPAYPTARDLDEAVADRPCLAVSYDGHSAWLNSRAARAAGITRDAPDPPGGAFVRDAKGRPTGYLLEAAAGLAWSAVPTGSPAERAATLRAAIERMVELGHTAVHAPLWRTDWSAEETVAAIERMYPRGCPLRICFYVPFSQRRQASPGSVARPEGRVRVAGVKCFLDGALGSRTAWMFEPYLDEPHNRGLCVLDPAELARQVRACNAAGLGVLCHAIGDRACAEALEAFERAGERGVGNRIEHAQHLRRADIGRFARAGVAASVQPRHLWTDYPAVERLLGPDRARGTYAFRSLLDAGAVLAVGSDAPVVPPGPVEGFRAAVTRTDPAGRPEGGWHPAERITPVEWAVAATSGAWRSVAEPYIGRLAESMACDLTLFDEDILHADPAAPAGIRAAGTVVAGRLVRLRPHGPDRTDGGPPCDERL